MNDKGKSLTDKIRSSMVLKLNLRMLGQLLSAFLVFNILASVLFFGIMLWKAETGAQNLVDVSDSLDGHHIAFNDYELIPADDSIEGWRLPSLIQGWLPIEAVDARRSINCPDLQFSMQALEKISYQIAVDSNHIPYRISYALGKDIRIYVSLLIGVIIIEFLYLITRIGNNTIAIRKILRPLSDMAETAKTLNEGMANMAEGSDGIKNLAGALSDIDARKLDRRISVDTSQNELKDLAYAINNMLSRISQSYESQVRFVSDASHELRTPISVIQGYVNLLDRWGKNDEKTMNESINAIKDETQNMKALVEQLLFLARGDNETIQLQRNVFDVSDIVKEVIRETRMIDDSHQFDIDIENSAYVDGDQQLIKQAIRILVDNSIKYTPEDEQIRIGVSLIEDNVRIEVQDNGIGIEPDDVSHIFDRFYRSDESRARKTGGSGLGLAIAKWIIQRHDGHFEVLSRLDIGTRITITLPSGEL